MPILALQRAERGFDGGRAALASRLGVSISTIGMWHFRSNIPTEYLKPIEDATGVSVYDLLADIEALRRQPGGPEATVAEEAA